jgi:hypothetical protein
MVSFNQRAALAEINGGACAVGDNTFDTNILYSLIIIMTK